MTEPFVPPQDDLKREMAERAGFDDRCPRCGTPGQRFLRRCPECGRRYRSLAADPDEATDFPANWADRGD